MSIAPEGTQRLQLLLPPQAEQHVPWELRRDFSSCCLVEPSGNLEVQRILCQLEMRDKWKLVDAYFTFHPSRLVTRNHHSLETTDIVVDMEILHLHPLSRKDLLLSYRGTVRRQPLSDRCRERIH